MLLYNFAFVGSCENEYSYCFDRKPTCWTTDKKNLKILFKKLRQHFLNEYKEIQKGNLKSYKNYNFGLTITIFDTEKDKAKIKNFYISPLNLKIK